MSRITDDPEDPRLPRNSGPDETPVPQQEVYLVLSAEERAKGFVRPVRKAYRHVGTPGPSGRLRDLTDDEQKLYPTSDYVKFEIYPEERAPATGRYWTQAQLDAVGDGCGSVTTMGDELSETYARDPGFYGATYCVRCRMHRPVGARGEFIWLDGSRVGT